MTKGRIPCEELRNVHGTVRDMGVVGTHGSHERSFRSPGCLPEGTYGVERMPGRPSWSRPSPRGLSPPTVRGVSGPIFEVDRV